MRCREMHEPGYSSTGSRHGYETPASYVQTVRAAVGLGQDTEGFTPGPRLGEERYSVDAGERTGKRYGIAVAIHREKRPDHGVPGGKFGRSGLGRGIGGSIVGAAGNGERVEAIDEAFERGGCREAGYSC